MGAVAVGRLGDRDVIITGSPDQTAQIWDTAGTPVGEPLTGHTDTVTAVAVGRHGDRDVIITGGWDETARIWDETARIWDRDGTPVGEPLTGHTDTVTAVAVGRLGDRDVIITGSYDETARIWDRDGTPVGERLPATARPRRPWVTALAAILPSPIGDRATGRRRIDRGWSQGFSHVLWSPWNDEVCLR